MEANTTIKPGPVAAWTERPPEALGNYWHWDGDEDHRAVVVDVGIIFDGVAYASTLLCEGLTPVADMQGWWQPVEQPVLPTGRRFA